MGRYCAVAVAGAYALNLFQHLPPIWLLIAVLPILLLCLGLRCSRLAGFLLLGFCASWLAAANAIDERLPQEKQGKTLSIEARVTAFPVQSGRLLRLLVSPENDDWLPRRIRLSWYDPPHSPQLGEIWHLEVRLRRPRGFANPSGFDYEGWLFRQGIGATGYVVNGADNRQLASQQAAPIPRYRRNFAARLASLLPADNATAVLQAVAVGARQDISRQQWDRYAVTGTSHLMAISGMHIGLAAGGVYLLVWALLSAARIGTNVRDPAIVAAIVAATLYAAVSGFAVPARRAFLMACLAATAVLARRQLPAARLIAVCALVVLLTDPLSIHAPGFKLSFAAVLLLLWFSRQLQLTTSVCRVRVVNALCQGIFRLGSLQLTLLCGLFPLTVFLFDRAAWLGPPVNLLVLPIFNLLTVPSSLLGMLLDGPLRFAGDVLLQFAHATVLAVLWVVDRAAEMPFAKIEFAAMSGSMLLVAALPAIYAVVPPGWPGRKLAWVALLASVLHQPAAPPVGCVDVHILDVGQGLAAVLQLHSKTLIYDTGPAFRSGSTAAELVLIPFLKRLGVRQPDLLVVSHADLDHAGGVLPLLREFDFSGSLVGEPLPQPALAQAPCIAGSAWRWDAVSFRVLHPQTAEVWDGNNASCVLQIRTGPYSVLLAGDIEAPVENRLLQRHELQRATLVVVPHHGSKTSSGAGFVRALRPQTAVVSAGYGNRWGFPKPEVVKRWRAAGARVLNTAESGAISQRFCSDGSTSALRQQRRQGRRYWHDRLSDQSKMQ